MDMMAHWVNQNYDADIAAIGRAMLDFKPRDIKGKVIEVQVPVYRCHGWFSSWNRLELKGLSGIYACTDVEESNELFRMIDTLKDEVTIPTQVFRKYSQHVNTYLEINILKCQIKKGIGG